MIRFAMMAALAAAPALAQADDCAVFGEIAEKAAQERQDGADMMGAMVRIAEQYTGDQKRFAGAVPLLADWVWKLPEEQLDEGVGAAYAEVCAKQMAAQN